MPKGKKGEAGDAHWYSENSITSESRQVRMRGNKLVTPGTGGKKKDVRPGDGPGGA